MTQFRTVRLSEQGRRWHAQCAGRKTKNGPIDWPSRTGRILGVSRCGTKAYVQWDGCRHKADPLPMTFFEPICAPEGEV